MPKPSSVRAFLRSIEGITLIERVLRLALRPYGQLKGTMEADQMSGFLHLSETYLKVSESCRQQLKADLQAQRDFEELKRQLEAGMTNAEVEQTLEVHFARKGWGSLDGCREMLFTYLTEEGLSAEQAREVIDNGLPKRETRSRQLPIVHKVRKAYGRIELAMAEGAKNLEEALSPSEMNDSGPVVHTTTEEPRPLSDETRDTEKK